MTFSRLLGYASSAVEGHLTGSREHTIPGIFIRTSDSSRVYLLTGAKTSAN